VLEKDQLMKKLRAMGLVVLVVAVLLTFILKTQNVPLRAIVPLASGEPLDIYDAAALALVVWAIAAVRRQPWQ
jgi:hypothetical protein